MFNVHFPAPTLRRLNSYNVLLLYAYLYNCMHCVMSHFRAYIIAILHAITSSIKFASTIGYVFLLLFRNYEYRF